MMFRHILITAFFIATLSSCDFGKKDKSEVDDQEGVPKAELSLADKASSTAKARQLAKGSALDASCSCSLKPKDDFSTQGCYPSSAHDLGDSIGCSCSAPLKCAASDKPDTACAQLFDQKKTNQSIQANGSAAIFSAYDLYNQIISPVASTFPGCIADSKPQSGALVTPMGSFQSNTIQMGSDSASTGHVFAFKMLPTFSDKSPMRVLGQIPYFNALLTQIPQNKDIPFSLQMVFNSNNFTFTGQAILDVPILPYVGYVLSYPSSDRVVFPASRDPAATGWNGLPFTDLSNLPVSGEVMGTSWLSVEANQFWQNINYQSCSFGLSSLVINTVADVLQGGTPAEVYKGITDDTSSPQAFAIGGSIYEFSLPSGSPGIFIPMVNPANNATYANCIVNGLNQNLNQNELTLAWSSALLGPSSFIAINSISSLQGCGTQGGIATTTTPVTIPEANVDTATRNGVCPVYTVQVGNENTLTATGGLVTISQKQAIDTKDLTAEPSETEVQLRWSDPNPESSSEHYIAYSSSANPTTCYNAQLHDSYCHNDGKCEHTVSHLQPGTQYYFRVCSKDENDGFFSAGISTKATTQKHESNKKISEPSKVH